MSELAIYQPQPERAQVTYRLLADFKFVLIGLRYPNTSNSGSPDGSVCEIVFSWCGVEDYRIF